jgi:hypothetical protein
MLHVVHVHCYVYAACCLLPCRSTEPPGELELALARRWLLLCLRCTGEPRNTLHSVCELLCLAYTGGLIWGLTLPQCCCCSAVAAAQMLTWRAAALHSVLPATLHPPCCALSNAAGRKHTMLRLQLMGDGLGGCPMSLSLAPKQPMFPKCNIQLACGPWCSAGAGSRSKSLVVWEKLLTRQRAAVATIRHRAATAKKPGATGRAFYSRLEWDVCMNVCEREVFGGV